MERVSTRPRTRAGSCRCRHSSLLLLLGLLLLLPLLLTHSPRYHRALVNPSPRLQSSCSPARARSSNCQLAVMSSTAFQQLPLHIWECICRELIGPVDEIWNAREQRMGCGTLAALARTCKSLHEPSLNVLWHTIPDIFVFFYALPRTCYRREMVYLGHFHKGHEYFVSSFTVLRASR